MPSRILIVDDEPSIQELVSAYLDKEGYETLTASDGPGGLKAVRSFRPDLVVLDVMLPGYDGIEFMQRLRRESDAYVIMLTARAEETDKIVGLAVGADDYLTKPFSPRELVARVKAALRRIRYGPGGSEPTALQFQRLRIDLAGRQVWADGQRVELTTTEFELLKVLAMHARVVLSRAQLLELVWGYQFYGEERVVDVHLGHIRQKLGLPGLIQTVRGVGYRFEEEPT